jgi:hypothetical protein
MPVKPTDVWLLNFMLHNLTPTPDDVFITYAIDFVPKNAAALKNVEPYWLDVADYQGANPVYNTQRGFGATPGECSFPKETCARFDPFGKPQPGNGLGHVQTPPAGTIVLMGGHVHPGGLRTDVEIQRGDLRKKIFTSDARYFDPNGPISWDMAMEVTKPDYRVRISPGDKLVLNSAYDTNYGSWYEGMGIVVGFIARGDMSGPDPFVTQVDPDNVGITHGHLAGPRTTAARAPARWIRSASRGRRRASWASSTCRARSADRSGCRR